MRPANHDMRDGGDGDNGLVMPPTTLIMMRTFARERRIGCLHTFSLMTKISETNSF
jgi:hypothetical protein